MEKDDDVSPMDRERVRKRWASLRNLAKLIGAPKYQGDMFSTQGEYSSGSLYASRTVMRDHADDDSDSGSARSTSPDMLGGGAGGRRGRSATVMMGAGVFKYAEKKSEEAGTIPARRSDGGGGEGESGGGLSPLRSEGRVLPKTGAKASPLALSGASSLSSPGYDSEKEKGDLRRQAMRRSTISSSGGGKGARDSPLLRIRAKQRDRKFSLEEFVERHATPSSGESSPTGGPASPPITPMIRLPGYLEEDATSSGPPSPFIVDDSEPSPHPRTLHKALVGTGAASTFEEADKVIGAPRRARFRSSFL